MNHEIDKEILCNQWDNEVLAQGDYCVLVQDRLKIYSQECQVAYDQYPRATFVNGSLAMVEVFPGHEVPWLTSYKEPKEGIAIALEQMGIYAVKPLECV